MSAQGDAMRAVANEAARKVTGVRVSKPPAREQALTEAVETALANVGRAERARELLERMAADAPEHPDSPYAVRFWAARWLPEVLAWADET